MPHNAADAGTSGIEQVVRASGGAKASPAHASIDFKPAQKHACPLGQEVQEADGTEADAKTGDKNGGRSI
jgi:hypothetical protein